MFGVGKVEDRCDVEYAIALGWVHVTYGRGRPVAGIMHTAIQVTSVADKKFRLAV